MRDVIINIVLVVFPILMYLVFSCYNSFYNKEMKRIAFIITLCTSFYFIAIYGDSEVLFLFINIPILISYIKGEKLLAIILSTLAILFSYIKFDINIFIEVFKYISYFTLYILLVNKREFNYLFLKIGAVIQGVFIFFEYFINGYNEFRDIIYLIIYTFFVYGITFFCLYLFKLGDNVSAMHSSVLRIKKDNKLKDSLFKLTHEIKNPLAVCKGYIDMMDLNNTDKSRRYIGIIKSELDRSLSIMADFMEYSKIKVNKEIIDLTMLTDDVFDSFKMLMDAKKITFDYQNQFEEILIMGDYDRLKQVFVNVLKNSMESIEKDGIINLVVSKNDKEAIVMVSDNGIGMDSEEIKNIKEMFFTTKNNGTGLGVALSNEIILAHDGKMEYESVKNNGTKCILSLPMI